MRVANILRYVQKDKERKRRTEKAILRATNEWREVLDGMPYQDAVYFSSHMVRFLESYLDGRSPLEVYRSVASWQFDEGRKPFCVRATLGADAFDGVDRPSATANIVILLERVANGFMPKSMPLKAKLGKGGIVELTGSQGVKAAAMKHCVSKMQSQQKLLLDRKSKMH